MRRSGIASALRAAIAALAGVDEGVIHRYSSSTAVAGRKAGGTFVAVGVAVDQVIGIADEAFAVISLLGCIITTFLGW